MKIPIRPNRILLKICHFFGFRLNEEHQDDVTVNIPTRYTEGHSYDVQDLIIKGESDWIIEDIFEQIYRKFKEYPKLEKRCRNVKMVITTYYKDDEYRNTGSIVIFIPYIDGELFNPYNKKVLKRQLKLKELLG
jgi:hypothetical protein